jgi:pimeloyl-ACP methyl ester carboxylesterase
MPHAVNTEGLMPKKSSWTRALGAALIGLLPVFVQAQDAYPTKPVRVVVGFPPSGISDNLARALAGALSRQMGQQFIIDNKPGAGTSIAADHVAKSAPDGYTLFMQDLTLKDGDAVPSGTSVDMCSKLPLVKPEKIDCPVYILRGEHDGIATLEDIMAFYAKLPNGDKHFSVMANSAHIAPLGVNRARFYHLLRWFLELQPAS